MATTIHAAIQPIRARQVARPSRRVAGPLAGSPAGSVEVIVFVIGCAGGGTRTPMPFGTGT